MNRALGCLVVSALAAAPQGAHVMEWKGAFCPVEKASHRLVTGDEEWERLWKTIGKPAPAADLETHYAVAVFLGSRPTGGFGVAFREPADKAGATVVRYGVKPPSGMVIQAFTQPYAVKLYPRTGKPVRVEADKP